MEFIKDIDRESIIICNDYVKDEILKMHILKPIKIMNIIEFIKNYYYDYDEESIIYIMNEYHVKYEIAKEYIDNIYYVDNYKVYDNSKLTLLIDIKNKLIDKELLKYNKYFIDYIRDKDIIIYDIKLNKYLSNIFKGLNYKVIDRKYNDYKHKIYEFNTMEEEVYYVANEIAKLIDKGIDVSNIKLTNVDSSYYNTINYIFSLFNLKLNINYKRKLSSYDIVEEFINRYRELDDINKAIDGLDKDNDIYIELIKVINKYIKYNNQELMIYKIENSYISDPVYDKGIGIIDYLNYMAHDDEYIFMLGFNEGLIPKYIMDTSYITDNLVDLVGLSSTRELNKELKSRVINVIKDIKNLTISYKLKDNKKTYYKSSLSSDFEIIKPDIDESISYSKIYNKIKLVGMYDNYIKYGYIDPLLNIYNNNYLVKYNSYDNKYTGINRDNNYLNLSYTKMNMYNKCNFRYYLNYVLKLDIYEENFSATIGSMVHYVLENTLKNNDYDIDKYACEFIKDKELSNKEKYFYNKYLSGIKDMLDFIIMAREYGSLTNEEYEKNIDIQIDKDIHFNGIIDKLIYKTVNNTTYIAIIDYKTGEADISFDYLDYGINIQIPIYMYLASKLDFDNIKYVGVYLQKFNLSNPDYRLVGYTNSDSEIIKLIDNDYENSKIIKGLKLNKDGSFSRYAKVISDEDIENIIDKTKDIIDKTINNIKDNKFDINPKVTEDDKPIGCAYCKFRDICFKKKEDETIILSPKNV